MGKKMLCALAMDGKFTSEDCLPPTQPGIFFTSLAKELLRRDSVREFASSVWAKIGQERIVMIVEVSTSEARTETTSVLENPTEKQKNCSLRAGYSRNLHTDIAICGLTAEQNDAGCREHPAPAIVCFP
jgi:hypothetical protein